MKRVPSYFLTVLSFFYLSCSSDNKQGEAIGNKQEQLAEKTVDLKGDTTAPIINSSTASHDSFITHDSVYLKESFKETDGPVNEFMIEELKPIRNNFKRINSISNWTNIVKKDLWLSTEGGEATFYYKDSVLEKIITRNYGEIGQKLTEYYLLKGELSFVFEKANNYKKPFDYEGSTIEEERNYFINGKLVHQLLQDCGSPFADEYLVKEQKRIKNDYTKLIALLK